MRTASPSNSDRAEFSPVELELAAILRQWNPLGVPDAAPEGEYDDLVRPILVELEHGLRPRALAVEIAGALTRDYGLAMKEQLARDVATRIDEWWTAFGSDDRHTL
ncbi:hypothetical protein AX769_01560 [Frondihabitans sp. PAMC 28766]|uniref:hypothetical protein n=1 Tax=Frondihabitans sp. PAMC 28766 TaxID=1795630 RepID=UPI00078EC3A5|nr:hypothetical protein [Frondihabitans sp. PAMC 28766]AMM19063.1 hypothetical protein AX769_01560 [Frondihabitans sp. PAMC 28766]